MPKNLYKSLREVLWTTLLRALKWGELLGIEYPCGSVMSLLHYFGLQHSGVHTL